MSNSYEPCPRCGERHKQCEPSQVEQAGLDYIVPPRREQKLYVSSRLDGLNEVIKEARTHWSHGANHKKAQQEIVEWAIVEAKKKGLKPVDGPFRLELFFAEPNTARDPDNIVSAKKFILDALQTMGIIPNDNQKYVLGFTESWGLADENRKVGVHIKLIED